MGNRKLLAIFLALIGMLMALPAQADDLAYTDPSGAGDQPWTGNLALDFTANSTITITSLGVFNALGNGNIAGPIEVAIFNTSTNTEVTPVVTFAGPYTVVGNDVFQAITPIVLGPGTYAVDAVGFSSSDPNGNINLGSPGPTLNTGGGALSFTGAAYDSNTTIDNPTSCAGCQSAPSPQNVQFDAGTFTYTTSMDEAPGIMELVLTMSFAGLALVFARKRINNWARRATETSL